MQWTTYSLSPLLFALQIVESNSSYFALDRKATPAATQEVIMQSIEKLLEKDSPALEMLVSAFLLLDNSHTDISFSFI